ncbi:MAG: hypothetical protein CMA72_04915 [Euryarchaeota archaeon]|jgi:hypothetical protein|nr:hypothetical protein [Euryarchaeota archaeon]|tara:strand:- start:4401 stop:4583 length:183 start_codon:yes stop_codon:yes gene_type:complete
MKKNERYIPPHVPLNEMKLIIDLEQHQGKQFFINGESETDSLTIAKAIWSGSAVISFKNF